MNRFHELRDMLMSMETDFKKFYDKGNKAAGTRVRKSLQNLKNVAQDIRMDIQKQKSDD